MAVGTRQGPLKFTAQQRGITRNKGTNKGTRPLQIVVSVMKRGKSQLAIISDDFRQAGQGNLKGSDI